jgi:hypothetical protein
MNFLIRYGQNMLEKSKELNESMHNKFIHGFHIISFEWNKVNMIWKIDGIILYELSIDRYFKLSTITGETYSKTGLPFDHKFKLVLSNEFFIETEYEEINDDFIESEFIIDYIKYYAWNESRNVECINKLIGNLNNNSNINYTAIIIISIIVLLVIVSCVMIFIFKLLKTTNIITPIIY